jgi:alpha-D-ribose 1-methylphosphonate 5-triphosphate synthase subunit PhnL
MLNFVSSSHLSRLETAEVSAPVLRVEALCKNMTLHHFPEVQVAMGSAGVAQVTQTPNLQFSILENISLLLNAGDCIALEGVTVSQKSIFLQALNGQYAIDSGAIWVKYQQRWVNLAQPANPLVRLARAQTMGYLGSILPLKPRCTAFELVMKPLLEIGIPKAEASERVQSLFDALYFPRRLWRIAPATLSACEQQRVNIARVFAMDYPILLLNSPETSLESDHRSAMVQLIHQRRAAGTAFIGIFHDEQVQAHSCNRRMRLGHS